MQKTLAAIGISAAIAFAPLAALAQTDTTAPAAGAAPAATDNMAPAKDSMKKTKKHKKHMAKKAKKPAEGAIRRSGREAPVIEARLAGVALLKSAAPSLGWGGFFSPRSSLSVLPAPVSKSRSL